MAGGRWTALVMVAAIAAALTAGDTAAGCPDRWFVGADIPDGMLLEAAARGADRWVAVGRDGAVALSGDGLRWGTTSLFGQPDGLDVAYGRGRFVAVGTVGGYPSYAAVVLTSVDGAQWESTTFGSTTYLGGIAADDSTFVAVGGGGTVLTSADGLTWVRRSAPTTSNLLAVAAGEDGFVAVGEDGVVVTSPDGVSWQSAPSGTDATLGVIATDGSTWLAAGARVVVRSTDGANWTAAPADTVAQALTFGAGRFLLVDENGRIDSSEDGVQWRPAAKLTPLISGLAAADGRLVAVGDATFASSDGAIWKSESPSSFSCLPGDVVWSAGRYLATGCDLLTSVDGRVWSTAPRTGDIVPRRLAHLDPGWVGVRTLDGFDEWRGQIMTSSDGLEWTTVRDDYMSRYNDVAAGAGSFVVIGDEGPVANDGASFGFVMVSPDGRDWVVAADRLPQDLNAIAFGRATFVVVGDQGIVHTSTDGFGWTEHATPTDESLIDVTFDGGGFVAVGAGGTVLTSGTGTSWTVRSTPVASDLVAVAAGNGCRVASGRNGTVIASADGVEWHVVATGDTDTLWAAGFGPPGFVVAGETYLRSRGDHTGPMPSNPAAREER